MRSAAAGGRRRGVDDRDLGGTHELDRAGGHDGPAGLVGRDRSREYERGRGDERDGDARDDGRGEHDGVGHDGGGEHHRVDDRRHRRCERVEFG